VSTLLALVQQGAGGNTLSQLTDVLYLGKEQSRQGYSQLTRNLKVIRSGEEIAKLKSWQTHNKRAGLGIRLV